MSRLLPFDQPPPFQFGAAADDRPSRTAGGFRLLRNSVGLGMFLLVAVTLVGCATLKGDGFPEADATWGTKYRTPPASKRKLEPFFFDEKSQQIERSLGL
ncbi:MAG: hypothetical protein ACKOBW_15915 [Planctomycetota bacterium]